jgi:hypothetical protein
MSLTADPAATEPETHPAEAPVTTSRSTRQPTITTHFWATLSLFRGQRPQTVDGNHSLRPASSYGPLAGSDRREGRR